MNYPKNILLTGAGFTKNFGGFLAEEMWAQIFIHPEVQKEWKLIEFMHKEFNYEKVYYEIMHEQPGFSLPQYRKAIHKALMQAYENLDSKIRNNLGTHEGVFQLINLFKGNVDEVGLVFSLNQDLYIERLFNSKSLGDLVIPGLNNDPYKGMGWQCYINSCGYNPMRLIEEIDINLSAGKLNYIKLHGSCNWKSYDGSDAIVIGLNKKEAIEKEPLLKEYYQIFKDALFQEGVKLLVIGYGFGDNHINEIISTSLEHVDNDEDRMKLYVVSPEQPSEFKKRLCEPHCVDENESEYNKEKIGRMIFDRLAGYFQCNLTEFAFYLHEGNFYYNNLYYNRIKETFS